jgi:hypothetical protein
MAEINKLSVGWPGAMAGPESPPVSQPPAQSKRKPPLIESLSLDEAWHS